jgi:hypothetical protein
MPENRGSKRVPAKLKVWCEGDDFTLLAETVNVSQHGMFVRSPNPLRVGECLRLNIEDLGAVAEVEVCWTREVGDTGRGGMGVRVLGFERGAHEYSQFVTTVRTPSGEFQLAWQPADRPPSEATRRDQGQEVSEDADDEAVDEAVDVDIDEPVKP